MTELQTSVLQLGEGLDLTSSKLSAKPGTLLSCLNYEVTDTKGLSRIDGYEPYDAQTSPSLTSLYKVFCGGATGVVTWDTLVVQQSVITTEIITYNLLVDDSDNEVVNENDDEVATADDTLTPATTLSDLTRLIVVGTVVDTFPSENAFLLMVSNLDALNPQATYHTVDTATAAIGNTLPTITSMRNAEEYYAEESEYYDTLIESFSTLRNVIRKLGYPASGLHYFRDTLYAVAALSELIVRTTDGIAEVAGAWTHTMTVGSWIGNDLNSSVAYIAAIREETDVNMFKRVYLDVIESDYIAWKAAVGDTESGLLGTGFAAGGAVGATGLIVEREVLNYTNKNEASLIGTLWYSKSIQQMLDDGETKISVGWRSVHQGWSVAFSSGIYGSAEIPKLERSALTIPTSATYWLTDGTNTYSCELVSYFLNEGGNFIGGTAAGTLQIRNITLVDGALIPVDNTFDLHSAYPIAAPTKVADLSGDMTYNSISTSPLLVQNNTRYEFISANFYADADWDAFYGVNGIGRAFYYTGSLFAKIYTQEDPVKDQPRHIAYHLTHLALGYKEGSVQLSVTGVPHSFDGDDGATEFGMGDRVTGLMPLNGDTLGVFCEQSIRSISGSSVDNFTQAVLAPNTGCIEYTLVNIGTPVYCNSSGIVSLEQSQKYGDFEGIPLSFSVNSFLRPRLNRVSGKYSPRSAVLAAIPVRTKNQYRLFFRDGICMTMTVPGDGSPLKFTTQQLTYVAGTEALPLIPFAFSSQTDENGEELLHFSHSDSKTGNYSEEVFELDKGWGFQGVPMAHEFETNWFAGESPNQFFGVQKVRMHGITRGRASMKVAASGVQNTYDAEYHSESQYIDLPRSPVFFTDVGVPSSSSTDLANRGMAIQLKFTNREVDYPEPSHICQVLVLQTKPGGRIDA